MASLKLSQPASPRTHARSHAGALPSPAAGAKVRAENPHLPQDRTEIFACGPHWTAAWTAPRAEDGDHFPPGVCVCACVSLEHPTQKGDQLGSAAGDSPGLALKIPRPGKPLGPHKLGQLLAAAESPRWPLRGHASGGVEQGGVRADGPPGSQGWNDTCSWAGQLLMLQ